MAREIENLPDSVRDREQYELYKEAIKATQGAIPDTPYGARKTAELSVRFNINPALGLTKKRYHWRSNGTRFDETNFSQEAGKINMETGATGTDTAHLQTSEIGEYLDHSLVEAGVGMSVDASNVNRDADNYTSLSHGEIVTGNIITDDNQDPYDGHGILLDDTGVYHKIWREGTEIASIAQEDWNVDQMDGTGPSGRIFAPEEGYVYQFIFTWYGEGPVTLAVESPDGNDIIPLHRYSTETDEEGHFSQPNGPMLVNVRNEGTAQSLGVNIGGIQFAVYGDTNEADREAERTTEIIRRTTGSAVSDAVAYTNGQVDPRASVGTPLMAVRRDNTDPLIAEGMTYAVQNLTADANSAIWVFFWDEYDETTALTGSSFGVPENIQGSETHLRVDTSATDYTPTEAVIRGIAYIPSSKKDPIQITGDVSVNVPIDSTVVATAVHETGETDTDVQPAIMKTSEGW